MNNIKFSVSMCVYGKDNPDWFRIAVDSILNQTSKPDEVVLVVDGPVPQELNAIVTTYENMQCFKVIRLEVNQGHGYARRVGIENCSNEFIALMDADDISANERFEKQIELFENDPTLDIVGGDIAEFIDSTEHIIGMRKVPSNDPDIKAYMKKKCPFNQTTVMLKKSSVNSVGGYMDWYCDEDYYLWLRMYLANMKFANIQNILVNVRVGKDMYQRRGGWKYYKSEARLQKFMLKKHIISPLTYFINCTKRFIVQVMLSNRLRGWVFQKFARQQ